MARRSSRRQTVGDDRPVSRQVDVFDLFTFKRPKKLLVEILDEKPPTPEPSPYRVHLASGHVLRGRY